MRVSTLLFPLLVLSCAVYSQGYIETLFLLVRLGIDSFPAESADYGNEYESNRNHGLHNHNASHLGDSMFETKKCYGELGCIDNSGSEWVNLNRPTFFTPEDRQDVNTTFAFFNREHMVMPVHVEVGKKSLQDAGFNAKLPTIIICHGFLDQGISFWPKQIAQVHLGLSDFNIFVVDWSLGAHDFYGQAAANTQVVGLEIMNLVKTLEKEFGIRRQDCHCIGHSLGSHVCGYAGKYLEGKLGRITGLDPAGPFFENTDPKVRLDPTDALFVDNIHTDGGLNPLDNDLGFGMQQACGHLDFYPNGGTDQPGCEWVRIPFNIFTSPDFDVAKREFAACNHHRAIYFYLEAVKRSIIDSNPGSCRFVGHVCDNYETYFQGKCYSCGADNANCAIMGPQAVKYPIGSKSLVKLFLSTDDQSQFCVQHYRVEIKLGRPLSNETADIWIRGDLKLSLSGNGQTLNDISMEKVDQEFIPGGNLTFMFQTSQSLDKVTQVKVDWSSNILSGIIDQKTACVKSGGCNHKLYMESILVFNMDQMGGHNVEGGAINKSRLCSASGNKTNYVALDSDTPVLFNVPC